MFTDRAEIQVKAGRGGDGSVSFLREKFMPHGGPDGGDGGRGGSIILRATDRVATLADLARQVHFRAESGRPGGKKNRTGRSGSDLLLEVPRGTTIRDGASGALVRDLTGEGEEFVIARGGRGGRGNAHFKSSVNQVPREWEPGEAGEEGSYALELKLIADVGLVGLPNSGKSTLLSRISAARPKIADYPFTTLTPVLGIVKIGEYRTTVVADIPGLIEGAHTGHGLGIEFLRHVERTRMLVHLVDMDPPGGPSPLEAYRQVRAELEAYAGSRPEGTGAAVAEPLAAKPEIVAANKMDLPDSAANLAELRRALGTEREIYPISAATGAGIGALLGALARHLEALPRPAG